MRTSHICTDAPTETDFCGQVIYGTNYDFEFSILRDKLFGTSMRGGRACDAVIIDEADNLFIDRGNDSAIIGATAADSGKWLVPAVVRFAEITAQDNTIKSIAKNNASVTPLRDFIEAYENGKFSEAAQELSDFDVRRLAESYVEAYVERQQDVHYVVRAEEDELDPARLGQDEVQIVDLGTGQLQPACRWLHRVHQSVEHRQQLALEDETVIAAELSHPLFINGYRNLFGVTGILGSEDERGEIREVYQTDTFDVPAHRRSQRTSYPMVLCATNDAYHSAMLVQFRNAQQASRARLVLLATIRATDTFSRYLTELGVVHQLLNGVQAEQEALVVARAGR